MSIKGDIWLADMVTNVSIRCLKGRVTPDTSKEIHNA